MNEYDINMRNIKQKQLNKGKEMTNPEKGDMIEILIIGHWFHCRVDWVNKETDICRVTFPEDSYDEFFMRSTFKLTEVEWDHLAIEKEAHEVEKGERVEIPNKDGVWKKAELEGVCVFVKGQEATVVNRLRVVRALL